MVEAWSLAQLQGDGAVSSRGRAREAGGPGGDNQPNKVSPFSEVGHERRSVCAEPECTINLGKETVTQSKERRVGSRSFTVVPKLSWYAILTSLGLRHPPPVQEGLQRSGKESWGYAPCFGGHGLYAEPYAPKLGSPWRIAESGVCIGEMCSW